MVFDTSATGANGASGTSQSWSHTVTSSGSNRLITITIWSDSSSTFTVSYNGVAATQIVSNGICAIFALANPATGANTVAITSTAGNVRGQSQSFTSAKQTFTGVTAQNTGGTASSDTLNITPNGAQGFLVATAGENSGTVGAITPGGGGETAAPGGSNNTNGLYQFSTYKAYTGTSANSMTVSWGASVTTQAHVAAEFVDFGSNNGFFMAAAF